MTIHAAAVAATVRCIDGPGATRHTAAVARAIAGERPSVQAGTNAVPTATHLISAAHMTTGSTVGMVCLAVHAGAGAAALPGRTIPMGTAGACTGHAGLSRGAYPPAGSAILCIGARINAASPTVRLSRRAANVIATVPAATLTVLSACRIIRGTRWRRAGASAFIAAATVVDRAISAGRTIGVRVAVRRFTAEIVARAGESTLDLETETGMLSGLGTGAGTGRKDAATDSAIGAGARVGTDPAQTGLARAARVPAPPTIGCIGLQIRAVRPAAGLRRAVDRGRTTLPGYPVGHTDTRAIAAGRSVCAGGTGGSTNTSTGALARHARLAETALTDGVGRCLSRW